MSWGDKELTGERGGENKTQKTKTNQKNPCRVWTWTQTRTVKKGGETRTSMRRIFSVPSLSSQRDGITAVKQCFRRSCREYLIFLNFLFYPWWNYFASTVLFILSQAELGFELSGWAHPAPCHVKCWHKFQAPPEANSCFVCPECLLNDFCDSPKHQTYPKRPSKQNAASAATEIHVTHSTATQFENSGHLYAI